MPNSKMPLTDCEEEALDRELDEICAGLREAIDLEVESLRREGFPIYVWENGKVINLQDLPSKPSTTNGS